MRGSESRLRHVLSELGQWVSPPLRVVHLLRRTHREALALSGSANGVTVDPATACMWPVRLPCARLPATLCLVPLCSLKARVVRRLAASIRFSSRVTTKIWEYITEEIVTWQTMSRDLPGNFYLFVRSVANYAFRGNISTIAAPVGPVDS